jgi:tetratricopeptide (TPR) repeat protein
MAYNATRAQLRHRLDAAIAAHQRGDIEPALAAYREILGLAPDHPVALNLLGTGLLQLGRAAEATPCLERAAKLQRDNPNLLSNLAQAYLALARYAEAAEAFRKASRIAPNEPQFQVGVATALALQGKLSDAEALLRRQAARFPTVPSVWLNLGNVLRDLHRYDPAIEAYRKARELDPGNPDACNNLGRVLHAAARFAEAEAAYRACLELDPTYAAARFNLASVIIDVGRFAEAESICRDIVAREPRNADAYAFLAATLGHQGRLLDAIVFHEKAALCAPGEAKHLANYGAALFEVGRAPEARRVLLDAIAASPGDDTLVQLLGNGLLAHGALQDGWRVYGARPVAVRFRATHPKLALCSTLPHDIQGRHICVLREQGLGDEIFFLRYTRVLAERGARVSYWAARKIASLVSRVSDIAQVTDESAPIPQADVYILLGDLPHVLGATPCSPLPSRAGSREPVLREFAEATRIYWPPVPESVAIEPLRENLDRMREQLAAAGPPPYIGVTWRAGTPPEQQASMTWMLYKHVALPALTRAISASAGTVIALQRNPAAGETDTLARALGRPVHDFTAYNENLESMLALLALLDEYVGVSNTNTHLRAAVGRTARVLVPAPAEWRWMYSGQSPWFPGFKIYRQSLSGDWDGALARLAGDLKNANELQPGE